MKPKHIAWIELLFLMILIGLFLWWISPIKVSRIDEIDVAQNSVDQISLFPPVDIEAVSAYVYDVRSGKVLFSKDAELQWPLASLTKLMVAFTASKIVPDYMLVRITMDDLLEEGDTGLFLDEEWNIEKLIDFALVVSSNDGMRAIASVAGQELARNSSSTAEILFVNRMNDLARELGLTGTYFLNHSGLDISDTLAGGYGSAKDMALLVEAILRDNPHILEATTFSKISIDSNYVIHNATNTNRSIDNIPNVLASKTGYTDLSGGNVVVAWNAGLDHPIIISVLGSSYDGRFNDLDTLIDATLKYIKAEKTNKI